jgi:hypothetical protein
LIFPWSVANACDLQYDGGDARFAKNDCFVSILKEAREIVWKISHRDDSTTRARDAMEEIEPKPT